PTIDRAPTSAITIAPLPIQLPAPIRTNSSRPSCSRIGTLGSSVPCVSRPLVMCTPEPLRTSSPMCARPSEQPGPMYARSSIRAPVFERMVPKLTVALGAHPAIVCARNACRKYCPMMPGTSASICEEPSSARSRPMTPARMKYDARAGSTKTKATPRAKDFRLSLMKTRSNPIRYYAMLIRVLTAPVPDFRQDDTRAAEPVTFGVPLPQGLVREPTDWAISTGSTGSVGPAGSVGDGAWRAVQARVLDRWIDGSARWVLVDAAVDSRINRASGRQELNLDTGRPGLTHASAIRATTVAGGAVQVDTGAAKFELRPGGAFPFAALDSAEGLVDGARSRLIAVDEHGQPHEAVIEQVEVESTGPVRTVVRLQGRLDLGGRSLRVTTRVEFYAGLSTVRLRLTVTNPARARHEGGFWDLGDPGSVLLKHLSLSVALREASGATAISCSTEAGSAAEAMEGPFEIYQDSSGGEAWQSSNHINRKRQIPVTFRGYRVRSAAGTRNGLRATPVVTVRRGDRYAGVAFRHFWQNFPRAIEADAGANALHIRFFPGQFGDLHELQGGEQKTHVCFLAAGRDSVSSTPLEWCREPTLACVDPAWTLSSNAVSLLAPLDDR